MHATSRPAHLQIPALLRTCRQIRTEGLPVYLHINSFNFGATRPGSVCEPDPIQFGVLKSHIHRMSLVKILLCSGRSHFVLDLRKGLASYDLTMERCEGDYHWLRPCSVNQRTLARSRRLLDKMVARAEAKGEAAVMDEAKLRALVQLVQRAS